ncbi:MAG: M23 family peptidase, partial [Sphingomonadaceae bacterium]|nr:M23 family peptidase [Sphingomonadaceae bacterium]
MKVAGIAAAALLAWLMFTLVMIGLQLWSASSQVALDQRAAAVAQTAGRVEAYRDSVESEVERIERRQAALDALVREHFGDVDYNVEPAPTATDEISAAIPEASALGRLEARQLAFAQALEREVEERTARAEAAIRE